MCGSIPDTLEKEIQVEYREVDLHRGHGSEREMLVVGVWGKYVNNVAYWYKRRGKPVHEFNGMTLETMVKQMTEIADPPWTTGAGFGQ